MRQNALNGGSLSDIPLSLVPVPVYVTLLHHPIVNRHGEQVTTAVTNMDIHDIARSARTYGVREYFIVTPIGIQRDLVGRILAHWNAEHARKYHPDRVEAVSRVRVVEDFETVKTRIREAHGEEPEVVLTDARPLPKSVSYADYRRELSDPARTRPALVVLGTGWGVSESFYSEADRILEPVWGPNREYNHLSVRAAAAVILDRLFGT